MSQRKDTNRKHVCFIGQNKSTCDYITRQLDQLMADHLSSSSWCLQETAVEIDMARPDLFLISSNAVLAKVQARLPRDRKILLADRDLNIENLDRLLELKPGMSTIVVGSSQETAQLASDILKRYGFDNFTMQPWWPNSPHPIPPGTRTAVTMGLSHLVPEHIESTIELGTKPLSMKTFRELADMFALPREVINKVSRYYIRALLELSFRRQKIAELNEHLKRERDIILNTISEAIIAVNQNNGIVLFNPAAESVFGMKGEVAMRKDAAEIIPEIDFAGGLREGKEYRGEILQIRGRYYVLETRSTRSEDYVTGVVATLNAASKVQELEVRVRSKLARKGQIARYTFADIVGRSKKLKEAITLSKKFAKSNLSILLEAESGCGKEVLAQSIHNYSNRNRGPFIAINFAALPEHLVESELFGYEQGAFSGANRHGKAGLFESAHTGTIFLDEIGDATYDVQKKLLRVLEEREIRRLGGDSFIPVDVRVISATNQDLKELAEQGMFRTDLFYRLNALPIILPPLRDRDEDIFLLASLFAEKEVGHPLAMSPQLQDFFRGYGWPGNIRELQNVVRYICHLVPPGRVAHADHLPGYLLKSTPGASPPAESAAPPSSSWNDIISELEQRDLLAQTAAILKEIRRSALLKRTIGRRTLVKRLQSADGEISEHTVRVCLDILKAQGLIQAGVTRQGCRITREGTRFLRRVESAPNQQ